MKKPSISGNQESLGVHDSDGGAKFESAFAFGDSEEEIQPWHFDELLETKKKRCGEFRREDNATENFQSVMNSKYLEISSDDSDSTEILPSFSGKAKKSQELSASTENTRLLDVGAGMPNSSKRHFESRVSNDRSGYFDDSVLSTCHRSFSDLMLSKQIQRAIGELGYVRPTPIQNAVIPVALMGKDIVAGAVTGSGKTAAYLIPILQRLVYKNPNIATTRVIILAPTRELAMQIYNNTKKLGAHLTDLRVGLAVGGLNLRVQERELRTRPDIVVGTPGRIIDHARNSPSFNFDAVEIFVIDEADRMLEEGFKRELTEILTILPKFHQTMLFSATMDSNVKDLIRLSMNKPVRLLLDSPKQITSNLVQEFIRIKKRETARPAILVHLLRQLNNSQRCIVFVSKKQTAHRLFIILKMMGIRVGELHGSLTQSQRLENIDSFRILAVPVLLCTNLASRGLDIPKIEVVVNYELPQTYDIYLHRVGRTARAGRSGISISLVGDSTAERNIFKTALKASRKFGNATNQKVVSRDVNWESVDQIMSDLEEKKSMVETILEEEKLAKELELASRDVNRAANLLHHEQEIMSRPKRTWINTKVPQKSKRIMLGN